MLTRDEFLRDLRGALTHLYDPDYLRQSPLTGLFGLANRFDTAVAMQRILAQAIKDIESETSGAGDKRAAQTHELLHCCYIEQMSQQEVADQMGICERHLRRKQRAALSVLADHLWEQIPPDETPRVLSNAPPTVEEELAWLKETPPESSVNLDAVLAGVLNRAEHLASQRRVRLRVDARPSEKPTLPVLAVHQVALEHALLNLVTVAIQTAAAQSIECADAPGVSISTEWAALAVRIEVRAEGTPAPTARVLQSNDAGLDIARRLADLCGGRLTLSDGARFAATLTIPAVERLSVLAIDDNADTLQLLQRYAVGTQYHLIGTRDPEDALTLAAKLAPDVIVLDVMMPRMDGWELLARLRQHPQTSHIPVIVCTILPQEDLALAMGANGYIRKPVSRQMLLSALNSQVERRVPESDLAP
ncbi:MAG: response regulator [Anaerolineales bacterium]|nr:response regulator [Anaerolineales bacterium]